MKIKIISVFFIPPTSIGLPYVKLFTSKVQAEQYQEDEQARLLAEYPEERDQHPNGFESRVEEHDIDLVTEKSFVQFISSLGVEISNTADNIAQSFNLHSEDDYCRFADDHGYKVIITRENGKDEVLCDFS